jgi:hypothetical protein
MVNFDAVFNNKYAVKRNWIKLKAVGDKVNGFLVKKDLKPEEVVADGRKFDEHWELEINTGTGPSVWYSLNVRSHPGAVKVAEAAVPGDVVAFLATELKDTGKENLAVCVAGFLCPRAEWDAENPAE